MSGAEIAAVVVAVVGAGTAVYSAQQQASAQKKASNRSADTAAAATAREAEDAAKEHQKVIATQEAMYGKAGFTMEGSPLLVKQTSLKESEEQLRRIREGGTNLSDMYRTEGKETQAAGNVKAVGETVKGVGSVYKIGNDYDWFK